MASYKGFIASSKRVSRSEIKPKSIYRISSYRNRSDELKSKAGSKSDLIFVIGLHEGKVNALKISEIKPDTFFKWLKKLVNPRVEMTEVREMADALKSWDGSGKILFEKYIKPDKSIYSSKGSPYRTYIQSGIVNVQEIILRPEVFTKKLGIETGVDDE